MLDVSVDTSELEHALEELEGHMSADLNTFLDKAGELIVEEAKDQLSGHFNTDTGKALDSIKVTSKDQNVITVGIDEDVAPYAVYLHEGTSDHWIEPVNAESLAWQEGGQWRFSKGHMVSGIKGYPFLTKAAEAKESEIGQLCEEAIEKAVKESGF